mmetsp:Transcript_7044/g.20562  ORF Transcript_7044/g.20562 Transcript_7044/m.20562 type:complete len:282 (+) Transcript_7044:2853-3698(+)
MPRHQRHCGPLHEQHGRHRYPAERHRHRAAAGRHGEPDAGPDALLAAHLGHRHFHESVARRARRFGSRAALGRRPRPPRPGAGRVVPHGGRAREHRRAHDHHSDAQRQRRRPRPARGRERDDARRAAPGPVRQRRLPPRHGAAAQRVVGDGERGQRRPRDGADVADDGLPGGGGGAPEQRCGVGLRRPVRAAAQWADQGGGPGPGAQPPGLQAAGLRCRRTRQAPRVRAAQRRTAAPVRELQREHGARDGGPPPGRQPRAGRPQRGAELHNQRLGQSELPD